MMAGDNYSYQIIRNNSISRDVPLQIPATGVARFVDELACRWNVIYSRTMGDAWADAVTSVLGGEVRSDHTSDLLLALLRAGKITGREMLALLGNHRRETLGESPTRKGSC